MVFSVTFNKIVAVSLISENS